MKLKILLIGFILLMGLVGAVQTVYVDSNHRDNAIFNVSEFNGTSMNLEQNATASWFNGNILWSFIQNVPQFILGIWTDNNENNLLVSNGTNIGYNQSILNESIANVINDQGLSGNVSWNQTGADLLYADIQWGYNMSDGSYNATYDSHVEDNVTWNQTGANLLYSNIQWDYNQTIPANTYTDEVNASQSSWIDAVFLKIADMFSQEEIVDMISGNLTEAKDYTNTVISGNESDWLSTYNATYDSLETNNNSWNQTRADELYAEIKWGYNQTTPANTYTDGQITLLNDSVVHIDGDETINGIKTFKNNLFSNGTAVTHDLEYATKIYTDSIAAGFEIKASSRVATNESGTLASDFENGDDIDSITLVTGDRILIKNQADPITNGIYTVEASGPPTRATDYDSSSEVQEGTFTPVLEGMTNENTQWVQITNDPVLDTDPLIFTQLSAQQVYTAGDGVDLNALEFSVDIKVDDGLKIDATELTLSYNNTLFNTINGVLNLAFSYLKSVISSDGSLIITGTDELDIVVNESKTNDTISDWITSNNIGDNQSWNETRGNELYLGITDQRYNETQLILDNNDSWLSTFNQTYNDHIQNNNSWNQTRADELYIAQSDEGNLNVNSSTWWADLTGWASGWFENVGDELTFNETKLNETISEEGVRIGFNSTYNATYDAKNSSRWDLAGSDIFYDTGDVIINNTLHTNKTCIGGGCQACRYWNGSSVIWEAPCTV